MDERDVQAYEERIEKLEFAIREAAKNKDILFSSHIRALQRFVVDHLTDPDSYLLEVDRQEAALRSFYEAREGLRDL